MGFRLHEKPKTAVFCGSPNPTKRTAEPSREPATWPAPVAGLGEEACWASSPPAWPAGLLGQPSRARLKIPYFRVKYEILSLYLGIWGGSWAWRPITERTPSEQVRWLFLTLVHFGAKGDPTLSQRGVPGPQGSRDGWPARAGHPGAARTAWRRPCPPGCLASAGRPLAAPPPACT